MAARRAFVLLRSWYERDGYRPAIVQEGVPGYTRADFLVEFDLYEAEEFLRMLNLRVGVSSDDLRLMVESCAPDLLPDAEL